MTRVLIDITEPLHVQVDKTIAALAAAGTGTRTPRVMDRGGDLVRISNERGTLEPMPAKHIAYELSVVCDYGKFNKDGEWVSVDPPRNVCEAVVSHGEYPGVPRVQQLVSAPTLVRGDDGDPRTLRTLGLDADSMTYYHPASGLERLTIEDAPVVEVVTAARDLLVEELLGDFQFADEASWTHALSLILLPFIRPFIHGQTPMHLILAPDVGSGKTYLAQACLFPACGLVAAAASAGNEDEWRKRITSTLRSAPPAVLLDNLSGDLDSPALAAAITGGTWSDRILGESREVTLPVRNVWVATGNNLGLSSEQVRRAIPIFLKPTGVRPSDRPSDSFRHPDLLGWADRNRQRLVEAALTLVSHWAAGRVHVTDEGLWAREHGRYQQGHRTLGSFEEWARVMGGVLQACGFGTHFLDNRARLSAESDEGTVEGAEFLERWQQHQTEPIRASDLAEMCGLGRELATYVPRDLPKGRDLKEQIGRWLGMHRGATIQGLQIERIPGAHTKWRVVGTRLTQP